MNFFISGTPKPQGRPRAVSMGKFTRVYSPITEWRETVVYHCAKQVEQGIKFENKPLFVHLTYMFERPKSHLNSKGELKKGVSEYHISKPDLDNLDKAILDAMMTAKLIDDDSRIVALFSAKHYSKAQGVYIEILEAD